MRRARLGAGLAALALACAPGERWDYTTPEVVDEAGLRARLAPTRPGELVLVNFWASWCGTCLAEMPELVALRPALEQTNVRVLAVSIDLALPQQVDTAEKLAAFVEQRGYALPVLAFRGDYDALADKLRLPGGPPCTLLFGAQGELGRIEGAGERATFEALVTAARER